MDHHGRDRPDTGGALPWRRGTLWDYSAPVAELFSDTALVHRWEQRGCGRSERTGPYSIARYVTDLECLRRHFGHQRWVVARHSRGAGLALRCALTHPDRVLGVLYLCGTGVGQAWREAYHRVIATPWDPGTGHH